MREHDIARGDRPVKLPGLAGLVFNHAYAVLDGSQQLVFVSEPASLLLTP